jgi:hypothetical protein
MDDKNTVVYMHPTKRAHMLNMWVYASLRLVLKVLDKKYRDYYSVLSRTIDGHTTTVDREVGVEPITPIYSSYVNSKQLAIYALEDVHIMYFRTIDEYLRRALTKEQRYALKIDPPRDLNKLYDADIITHTNALVEVIHPIRWNGKQHTSLRKIIYTTLAKGIHNIYVNSATKQRFATAEELAKSLSAYRKDFDGTFWFNGCIVTSVFQMLQAMDTMYIKKETDVAYLEGSNRVILTGMLKDNYRRSMSNGKPVTWIDDDDELHYKMDYDLIHNDGRYLRRWRLEKFYENNPDGVVYAIEDTGLLCTLRPLYPEDKMYKNDPAIFVYGTNPETEGMTDQEVEEFYAQQEKDFMTKSDEFDSRKASKSLDPEAALLRDREPVVTDAGEIVLEYFLAKHYVLMLSEDVHTVEELATWCLQSNIKFIYEDEYKERAK